MSARPNFAQALTIETKISSPCTANNIAGIGDAPIIVASMDAAKAASQIVTKSDREGRISQGRSPISQNVFARQKL